MRDTDDDGDEVPGQTTRYRKQGESFEEYRRSMLRGKTSSRPPSLNPEPFLKMLKMIDRRFSPEERGDLLVFLPGVGEIDTVLTALREYAAESRRWIVLPLHASLAAEEQEKVTLTNVVIV